MTEAPMNEKMLAREPSEEMVQAALTAPRSERTAAATNSVDRQMGLAHDIYRAMFDAAPDRTPAGEASDIKPGDATDAEMGRACRKWNIGTPERLAAIMLTRPQASLTASPPPASDEAVERAAADAVRSLVGDLIYTDVSTEAEYTEVCDSASRAIAQALASAGLLYPGPSKETP